MKKDDKQIALLPLDEWWREHWKGMPEFVQQDFRPFKSIMLHFETREDMQSFAKLIEQRITLNTKSLWYPEAEPNDFSKHRYVDKQKQLDNNIEIIDEE